jgi:hypothetical protein
MSTQADTAVKPKTIAMKKADYEKWVAALRSGSYVQAKGRLVKPYSYDCETGLKTAYCCLGVLQMVLDGECEARELPSEPWLQAHGIAFYKTDYTGASVRSCSPHLTGVDATRCSTTATADSWNDAIGADFNKLADMISEAVEFTDTPEVV